MEIEIIILDDIPLSLTMGTATEMEISMGEMGMCFVGETYRMLG